ncbi:MAG TPA: phosphatidate cytidylyltransferase [Coriobacteriia bacterium]
MVDARVRDPDGIQPAGLGVRVATAAVYALVVLLAIWFHDIPRLGRLGPLLLAIVVSMLAGFCASEFYAMERRESRLPNETFGVAAAVLMPLAAAIWGLSGLTATVTALIAASLVWHVVFVRVRTTDTATTVFGAVYTGFLLAYLVLIVRNFTHGRDLALAVVIGVWANDSLAYLIGSTLGRHKMMPRISPKKSWEGFIAGALGTIAVWVALALWFPQVGVSLPLALVTGVVVGASVVIGDLFESRMKREAGVKDAGTALPGHGGFLDRLDSLILVGLLAYWILHYGGVR